MILLLPPSEGKTEPKADGNNLALSTLPFPELSADRERVIRTLVRVSNGSPKRAKAVLGLSAGQDAELKRNQLIMESGVAPASEVYAGVMFAALDFAELGAQAKKRANQSVLITSSLFGMVQPASMICAYRLSGGTTLPRLGRLSTFWRSRLAKTMDRQCESNIVLDLRSGTYEAFWPIPKESAETAATVKIWQRDSEGERTAVTHFSKHTKGLLARSLLRESREPSSLQEVVECVRDNGWIAELTANPKGIPRLDVTIEP